MECMDTDLGKYMKSVPGLDPNVIKSFLFQILLGVSYCHSQGIVHRDLKPDNILLDLKRNTIKIADFGHIGRLDDAPSIENKKTTMQYDAPELLLGEPGNATAVDMWSVGCTFAEMMLKGKRLFPGIAPFVVLTMIIKMFGVPSEQDWPGIKHACLDLLGGDLTEPLPVRDSNLADKFADVEPNALDLLTKMLCFLPNQRIPADDALQHPYFNDLITASWTDERFKYPRQIGKGAFGYVYKCIDALTHSDVAVKIIRFERKEGAVPPEILKETAALLTLNHPNVVRVILVKEEAKLFKIAMEYVDTDLGKYIKHAFQLDGVSVLDPKVIKRFLFQILRGIFHCHSHGIVHRDVKPDNLLLDLDKNRIKIADFGHIRRADDAPTETKTTTIQYNAPEILLRVLENTTAVDIWSVGCTFAEMLKGKPLFFGSMDYVVLRRIIRTFGLPSEQDWPGVTQACLNVLGDQMLPPRKWDLAELFADIEPNALDLLTSMLRFLPNERITVVDAMQHPYFHDLFF